MEHRKTECGGRVFLLVRRDRSSLNFLGFVFCGVFVVVFGFLDGMSHRNPGWILFVMCLQWFLLLATRGRYIQQSLLSLNYTGYLPRSLITPLR